MGAGLTWTQIHRCAASCCPVGSGAAFCIYLGPLSHSRHVGRHSVSSWFRLWPRPTLNSVSVRSKRRKDERGMRRKEKYNKIGKRSKENNCNKREREKKQNKTVADEGM